MSLVISRNVKSRPVWVSVTLVRMFAALVISTVFRLQGAITLVPANSAVQTQVSNIHSSWRVSCPLMLQEEYCDAGTYCTDSGCCPNGSSLEECGASKSLSVIPPTATPSTSVTASAPRSSSTSIGSTIVKSSRSTTTSSSTSVKTYASSSLGATSTANKTSNPTVPSQPPSATANESQKLMSSIFGVVTGVAALLMIL